MSVKPKIELTADGSHTLFVPELDEHYHSTNGAVQESMHVFIRAGLNQCDKECINIFEVGLGTGLNAFLTALECEKSKKTVHYISIESYPLDWNIVNQLNYKDAFDKDSGLLFEKIHNADWNKKVEITSYFDITKINADFTTIDLSELDNTIDLIYFDAFAPDKQSEMWTQELFDKIFRISSEGGILTTYCAKGIVRRMMQHAGYYVERLPGPPGKREMLRAVKPLISEFSC